MTNFVQTMVQLGCDANAAFKMPSRGVPFAKGLAVAIERLVPCTYVAVKNSAPMPEAHRQNQDWLIEFYHGTTLQGALGIMARGFQPGVGAGSDELNAFYGFNVPGVFVAPTFSLALTYPNFATTEWVPGRGSVNGGQVPTLQHTCPLRVVFRLLAVPQDRLWMKKDGKEKRNWNTQFQFMPGDLYITHVYFVGVGYDLISEVHPHCTVETFGSHLVSDDQVKRVVEHASCRQSPGGKSTV